jgi:cell division control protein 6
METECVAVGGLKDLYIHIEISTGKDIMIEEEEIEENSIEEMWDDQKKIFKDKSVVKTSYVPDNISGALHRKDVIKEFQRCLIDVNRNLAPNNVIVYGKMGTGKTLVSTLVLTDLKKVAEKRGKKVTVIEIKCDELSTENAILGRLNNALMFELLGKSKVTIGNSKTRNNLYFNHYFNDLDGILIILLDEISGIKDPNLINNLTRTISTKNRQPPCLVMTTNDIYFKETLNGKTKSVLAENEIIFNPYDAEQLSDILKARAKLAFYPDVLGEMVIPLCSAFAAQEHGDARKAIELLCKSGEIAEEKGKSTVEEEDVRDANDRLELDRLASIVRTLPTQSKLTLYACLLLISRGSKKSCTTGEIYNIYRQLAHHIDVDILTQRRVTDLISELDTLGIINAIVESKGRYGRMKTVIIHGPLHQMRTVLLEDYRFKPLVDFKTSIF